MGRRSPSHAREGELLDRNAARSISADAAALVAVLTEKFRGHDPVDTDLNPFRQKRTAMKRANRQPGPALRGSRQRLVTTSSFHAAAISLSI